jgi:hypothetical protein
MRLGRDVGLAVGVLAGLLGNTLLGLWWLDPAVALIAAAAAAQGGVEARQGTRRRGLLLGEQAAGAQGSPANLDSQACASLSAWPGALTLTESHAL